MVKPKAVNTKEKRYVSVMEKLEAYIEDKNRDVKIFHKRRKGDLK